MGSKMVPITRKFQVKVNTRHVAKGFPYYSTFLNHPDRGTFNKCFTCHIIKITLITQ